ncbi:hypothetical protein DRN74_04825 [Candidatus Micrarchaeota archaeon]|mgnify:CR=1 FL=1|nr:MAG: hypothetical protein DRN74_04825 [Candidatus Micrarchaeota archaeon]
MKKTEIKILFVTNIISPYRIPLFNKLHEVGAFKLKVVALAEKEKNREWQLARNQIRFNYQILPGWHTFLWSKELPIHLNWGLWRALRRYDPDVIISSGYDALAYWEAFLYSKVFKKKFILWNGTTLLSTRTTGGFIGQVKRFIIRGADRYVAYGTKAAEYLESLGAPKDRIHIGINTVDMQWFRDRTREIRAEAKYELWRSHYPSVLVLFVGQLIPRKGLEQLLYALSKLRDPDIGLMVVGSGPEERSLQGLCEELGVQNVYWKGFHQQNELPYYYSLSDGLVLPSTEEVWGLVVNEALASGLYVLCSNRAGAAYDLIKEGWNGRTFNPRDVDQLAGLIRETKEQIKEIRARREAISEYACREFSIERSAKAFLVAIRAVTEK